MSYIFIFLAIILFVGLAAFLQSPRAKGKIGESIVNYAIQRRLDSAEYKLFKDLTIPATDGTTQIDHIVVSRYGIFVIETKNMKGWIFGSARQKKWTQKLRHRSFQFQNPLHQNYRHVKALQSVLALTDQQIFSIVTFVGESTLKTAMPENVFQDAEFIHYIQGKRDLVLSSFELEEIEAKLEKISLIRGYSTDQAHKKSLRSRKNSENS